MNDLRMAVPPPILYPLHRLLLGILFLSFYFRATPLAHRGSQARGQDGAVAAGLRHSHNHSSARSEPHPLPTPQLTAAPDP